MSVLGHAPATLPWTAIAAAFVVTLAALWLAHCHAGRPRAVVVPFLDLWRTAKRATISTGARPRSRWRLLLHAAIAGALLFAATDLRPVPSDDPRANQIVLIDRSASMRAQDRAGVSRFEHAQRAALDLVRSSPRSTVTLIAGFAAVPTAGGDFLADPRRLANAVAALPPPEDEAPDLAAALRFSAELLRGRRAPSVVVIGDGGDVPDGSVDLAGISVRFVPIGEPTDNSAITLLALDRPGDGRPPWATVAAVHFGGEPCAAELSLRDDTTTKTLATFADRLSPGQPRRFVADLPRPLGGVSASLACLGVPPDSLPADNRVRLAMPRQEPRRILWVGDREDRFLAVALAGLADAPIVTRRGPEEIARAPAAQAAYDVVIHDGKVAAPVPARTRALFLAPFGASAPWQAEDVVHAPPPTDFDRQHPLLADLSLASINIRDAHRVHRVPPGDRVIVGSFGTPLLLARDTETIRAVGLTFDPRRSDLPLRPEFPLLVANVVDWLAPPAPATAAAARPLAEADLRAPSRLTIGGHEAAAVRPAAAGAPPPEPPLLALLFATVLMFVDIFLAPPPRSTASWVLQAMLGGVIAGAVADPKVRRHVAGPPTTLLLDTSASVDDQTIAKAWTEAEALLRAATDARIPARLLTFASGARPVDASPPPTRPLVSLPASSNIADALAFAAAPWRQGDRAPRVLLLSDGASTAGDELAVAASTRAVVDTVVLPSVRGDDAAIVDVTAPRDLRPDQPFDLAVRVDAGTARRARLIVAPSGAEVPLANVPVELAPGSNHIHARLRLAHPGPTVLAVSLSPDRSDPRPDNDRATAVVDPQAPPRALVLRGGDPPTAFAGALARAGFSVSIASPTTVDQDTLATTDLVALSDVAPAALYPAAVAALSKFVRDGGGLLIAAGPRTAAAFLPRDAPLTAIAPARDRARAEQTSAPLALALVIDRSGSMAGDKLAMTKEAARGSAALLRPDDLITIVAFDSRPQTLVRLQPAFNRQRILGDIAQLRAGGGTNLAPALREAVVQLAPAQASRKHIVILSDGQSPTEGIDVIVDEAVAAGITLSAVAVGDGADAPMLHQIATRGGGRFHATQDPHRIPQIFSREAESVSRARAVEIGTRMVGVSRSALLAGLDLRTAPTLRGYVTVVETPGAEIALRAPEGDPLLLRHFVGAGQVAIWASDLAPRWSARLAAWPGFATFWGRIAHAVRRTDRGAAAIAASLDNDRVATRVVCDALSCVAARVALLPVIDGRLRDDRAIVASLTEIAPGIWSGRPPLRGDEEAVLARVELQSVLAGPWSTAGSRGVTIPRAREVTAALDPSRGPERLAEISRRTGGRTFPSLASVDVTSTPEVVALPLRGHLSLVALALFLAAALAARATFFGPRSGRGAVW